MARDDDYDRVDDYDQADIREAERRVKAPAIALLVVGIVSLLMMGISVVSYFTYLPNQFAEQRAKLEADLAKNPEQQKQMLEFMDGYEKVIYAVTPVQWVAIAVTSLVVIVGAMKMMSLSSSGWAKAASIIAMLPVVSGCCLLGLPFGIWALTVLANPDVKRGFAAKRRMVSGRSEPEDDLDR